MVENPTAYPMNLSIDYPDRPLNRLTTFFRIFMFIPIFIIVSTITGGSASWGWGWNWSELSWTTQYGAAGLSWYPWC